ncbi:hypothetical protein [Natronorubrum sulfidifaciens]|uniref:Uncharacterized protein n=1 Tax=Natronorubrum sulfidifaciens JCM 14089 TaxID=1230460 RepID=L9WA63_9EURY|nr:hypothetical protein [Natronorubrum sulfidifaciens]ELY46370.1 hypothetical protein C495_07348 [Natronorubrum sulfidifaciens JCM 14089]
MDIDIVDDLKQPAYTGENRCGPCTILNLLIAGAVGSLLARKSRFGGLLAVGVSIVLIYLRGYLVPGTPTLTKRYLPPEILRWFGKDPEPALASGFGTGGSAHSAAHTTPADSEPAFAAAEDADEKDPAATPVTDHTESDDAPTATSDADADHAVTDLESYFLDHEILEPCADKDDLCLTESFEESWFARIEDLTDSELDATTIIDAFGFDADPDAFDLESRGDVRVLRSERAMAGRWPSRAALLADVAASRVLETWTPDWDSHDPETSGRICNSLRMFLETCPTGGTVSMGEDVVESCCSAHDVVAVTCDETGERLFEQRLDTVDV